MRELWRLYQGYRDRKVIFWSVIVAEKNSKEVYQDKEIILERYAGEDDTKWRLISQRWFRKYIIDNDGNKNWIENNHDGIEKSETYNFNDFIKVRFCKQ